MTDKNSAPKRLSYLSLGTLPFGKVVLYGLFELNDLDFEVKVRGNVFHIFAEQHTLDKIWKLVHTNRRKKL